MDFLNKVHSYSYTGYDNDAEYEQVSTSGTVAGNINET